MIAVIALDPHDERTVVPQGPPHRSLRSVETKTSLKPDFKRQCSHSSLLHNQEQSAKANKNGWGDKSIGNTQSQQFTVEQLL